MTFINHWIRRTAQLCFRSASPTSEVGLGPEKWPPNSVSDLLTNNVGRARNEALDRLRRLEKEVLPTSAYKNFDKMIFCFNVLIVFRGYFRLFNKLEFLQKHFSFYMCFLKLYRGILSKPTLTRGTSRWIFQGRMDYWKTFPYNFSSQAEIDIRSDFQLHYGLCGASG